MGTRLSMDDIGLGAVVGSAVFNIIFVISVCALFAGMVTYLAWWPLFRDCLSYLLSIIALVVVIQDGKVVWYEALTLLIMYVLYIVLMCFNYKLESIALQYYPARCGVPDTPPPPEDTPMTAVTNGGVVPPPRGAQGARGDLGSRKTGEKQSLVEYQPLSTSSPPPPPPHMGDGDARPVAASTVTGTGGDDSTESSDTGSLDLSHTQGVSMPHLESEHPSPFSLPPSNTSICRRVLWALSIPIYLLLVISIPDCRKPRWKKCFLLTFLMSCVWISAFSYLMVWMIAVLGFTLSIPDTIMGLTFIAFGVSVPDAIASLLVAKDGLGDMAVSNAVASNVFDILLCLGLPWFLQTAVIQPNSIVLVRSHGLEYSAITLLSTVVFLLVSLHMNGWKLTIGYGVILLVVYVLYMVLASLYELNIFTYANPPACPSDF